MFSFLQHLKSSSVTLFYHVHLISCQFILLVFHLMLRIAVALMPAEGKLYCVLHSLWYWPLMASTEVLYVHLHSCQDLMSGSPGRKALVFS